MPNKCHNPDRAWEFADYAEPLPLQRHRIGERLSNNLMLVLVHHVSDSGRLDHSNVLAVFAQYGYRTANLRDVRGRGIAKPRNSPRFPAIVTDLVRVLRVSFKGCGIVTDPVRVLRVSFKGCGKRKTSPPSDRVALACERKKERTKH